jgi:phage virion morphogenesis protein
MSDAVDVKFYCEEALGVLDRIARKGKNAVPLMREIAGIMTDAVEENFEKEGRPKWAPLAASTIRNRQRKGNWPGRILQVRGKLAASIQSDYDATNAVVGTNDKRARIHQMGGIIRHAARERVLHFSQHTRGKMTHGKPGKNVDHFAKPGKAQYGMKVQGKAYETTIPARPFLHLEPTDGRRILEAARRFLGVSR